jgi:hypothetical protein
MSETPEVYEANQRALREAQEKQMNAAIDWGSKRGLANAVGKMPRRVVRRPHYKAEALATRKALWWVLRTLALSLAWNVFLLITR